MLLLVLLLLSSVAHAQEDAFVGPPSVTPAATVMAAQVRMVQEGDQLRLLVDAMSGDNDVDVFRPHHPDAEPLLESLQLSYVSVEQLEAHERAEAAAFEALADSEEAFPELPDLPLPEGRRVSFEGAPNLRTGRSEANVVRLYRGIWTPIAEAWISLPAELRAEGGRLVLRSDVRLSLPSGSEVVPVPDVALDLQPVKSAG